MQDPLLTIRLALATDWSLSGDLAKANLNFRTGWYDKKFGNLQVTVMFNGGVRTPADLGMKSGVLVWRTIEINAWVKAKNVTNKGVGKAKEYVFDMEEEINSLIKANKTGLTDIRWMLPGPDDRLDDPEQVPPLLRYMVRPTIGYYA